MAGEDRKAWDQQEGESARAYALFLTYRGMGVARTVASFAREQGIKPETAQAVSSRFGWVFRADQWDAWALRARSRAQERRLLREAQIEARTVTDVVRTARILARRALVRVRRDKGFGLTPTGAAQLADLAVKLSRLDRGEATGRVESVTKRAREGVREKIERVARIVESHGAKEEGQ